jgi:hypothetical protein
VGRVGGLVPLSRGLPGIDIVFKHRLRASAHVGGGWEELEEDLEGSRTPSLNEIPDTSLNEIPDMWWVVSGNEVLG